MLFYIFIRLNLCRFFMYMTISFSAKIRRHWIIFLFKSCALIWNSRSFSCNSYSFFLVIAPIESWLVAVRNVMVVVPSKDNLLQLIQCCAFWMSKNDINNYLMLQNRLFFKIENDQIGKIILILLKILGLT